MEWTENLTGLQHIGIPTENIRATADFYHRLGFETALETDNEGSKVVFLKLGSLVVETYEVEKAAGCEGAIDHMALNVRDIREAYRQVSGLGIRILQEITFLPFWENGVKFFIAEGPNRERIEFAQYL